MTKQEILNYVMTTLNNTNRIILKQMLDDISGQGGGNIPLPEFESYLIGIDEDDNLIIDISQMPEVDYALTAIELDNEIINFIIDMNNMVGLAITNVEEEIYISYINYIINEEDQLVCIFENWPPEGQIKQLYRYANVPQNLAQCTQCTHEDLPSDGLHYYEFDMPFLGNPDTTLDILSYIDTFTSDNSFYVSYVINKNTQELIPIANFYTNYNLGLYNTLYDFKFVTSTYNIVLDRVQIGVYGAGHHQDH